MINIIGLGILALVVSFILRKKNKRLSDYLLLEINVLLALFLFSDWWIQQGLTSSAFILQNVAIFFILPSFLIYGLLLISPGHRFRMNWVWFATFAFTFMVYLALDFSLLNRHEPEWLEQLWFDPPLTYHFYYKGNSLLVIACMIWFLSRLNQYEKSIREYYSTIESIQLRWLRHFAWTYLVINVISLLGFLLYNFGWIEEINWVYMAINVPLVLALFYLSYHGIRQYSLADFEQKGMAKDGNPGPKSQVKYQSSSLSEEQSQELYRSALELLKTEKGYTEPQLRIQHLAERLEVSTHHLSQAINYEYGKPFYDLVNALRVKHLQELLESPEHQKFTILALGLESGFNSKASLNRIFKQHTGMTPRESRDSMIN